MYELWRGNPIDDSDGEIALRFNPWRKLHGPRSPGAQYRQQCAVQVLQDAMHEAGVWPWPDGQQFVRVPTWLDWCEITFTTDAVYERPLPPRSRVPEGLQKRRLDGRRQR